jgi:hypothetical protein
VEESVSRGHTSPSGARIATDFRDNLIIDRYDPLFASTRATTRRHLHAADGEDAVTWNVFRSLRQIAPSIWLPELFSTAFGGTRVAHAEHATVTLWQSVAPPRGRALEPDEGDAEIDVVVETPAWVWFIAAKLDGDVGSGATRKERGQVLRYLDVGSYYAGVRQFYFSLLVADRARSAAGVAAVTEYASLARPRALLAEHRPDQLRNLADVSLLTWTQLGEVLADAADATQAREDERGYATRAHAWLTGRGLVAGAR